ncbi:3-dehydroquinate synthase [Bacillus alkalicellulosilyticus]|uniref:3-dehydroquinate synthase n=1 Tax=Alkalihalobacterium alkalicellulosilyticum TaxID=1912214 RepID=UPI0009982CBC|nr:3-dehydroquinate synthase [Bacillus alkalicellulosilyticus]
MTELTISTKSKTYPVVIEAGIRHRIGSFLTDHLKLKVSSILIITDDTVANLYLSDVHQSVKNIAPVVHFIIPSGEQSKSFQAFYDIQTVALENGLDRHSLIIALGGGVVGDLAGFVAATYMRGIPFIQVPTTLLAHDSSVGGKVAINHPVGKNMIGAFHQPEAVLYDIDTLQSLPEHEWRSGFAEVMKHSLIWDYEFYRWLQDQIESFSVINGELAEQLLERSIGVKAAVVAEDEKETGMRAFLNFGHTLGHAIEAKLGYGKMTHGEAVVIGMVFALKLSQHVNDVQLPISEITDWFRQYGYATAIPANLSVEELVEAMKMDKKTQHGVIRMVLLQSVGEAKVVSIAEEILVDLLHAEMRGE